MNRDLTEQEFERVRPIIEAVGGFLNANWKQEPKEALQLVLAAFSVAVHFSHLILSERKDGTLRVRWELEGEGIDVLDEHVSRVFDHQAIQ